MKVSFSTGEGENKKITNIDFPFDEIQIGDLIINASGIFTSSDVHVGMYGTGAAVIVNDGNRTNGEGVRLQATECDNVTVELPNSSGQLKCE